MLVSDSWYVNFLISLNLVCIPLEMVVLMCMNWKELYSTPVTSLLFFTGMPTLSAGGWEANLCNMWNPEESVHLSDLWFCWMWKVKQYVLFLIIHFLFYGLVVTSHMQFCNLTVNIYLQLLYIWIFRGISDMNKGMLFVIGVIHSIIFHWN